MAVSTVSGPAFVMLLQNQSLDAFLEVCVGGASLLMGCFFGATEAEDWSWVGWRHRPSYCTKSTNRVERLTPHKLNMIMLSSNPLPPLHFLLHRNRRLGSKLKVTRVNNRLSVSGKKSMNYWYSVLDTKRRALLIKKRTWRPTLTSNPTPFQSD